MVTFSFLSFRLSWWRSVWVLPYHLRIEKGFRPRFKSSYIQSQDGGLPNCPFGSEVAVILLAVRRFLFLSRQSFLFDAIDAFHDSTRIPWPQSHRKSPNGCLRRFAHRPQLWRQKEKTYRCVRWKGWEHGYEEKRDFSVRQLCNALEAQFSRQKEKALYFSAITQLSEWVLLNSSSVSNGLGSANMLQLPRCRDLFLIYYLMRQRYIPFWTVN